MTPALETAGGVVLSALLLNMTALGKGFRNKLEGT